MSKSRCRKRLGKRVSDWLYENFELTVKKPTNQNGEYRQILHGIKWYFAAQRESYVYPQQENKQPKERQMAQLGSRAEIFLIGGAIHSNREGRPAGFR